MVVTLAVGTLTSSWLKAGFPGMSFSAPLAPENVPVEGRKAQVVDREQDLGVVRLQHVFAGRRRRWRGLGLGREIGVTTRANARTERFSMGSFLLVTRNELRWG